jgi:protein SCO1/2
MYSAFRTTFARLFVLIAIVSTGNFPVFAHKGEDHAATPASDTMTDSTPPAAAADTGVMGIEEKPGKMLPLDLSFVTEKGNVVRLRDVVKAPTILCMLYYKCPDACNLLLTSIANVLRTMADGPGKTPNVLCMSVDERETPADAMKARTIAFEAIQKPYPAERWRFLTGSAASIKTVADAVGFRFVKRGDDFDHPLCLIILSPQGKVTRYILGTDYLPIDITMSLMEASEGAVQPTIARVLRACFSYDPKSHRFVFNILRVSATAIFALIGAFILYLVISGRQRRAREKR